MFNIYFKKLEPIKAVITGFPKSFHLLINNKIFVKTDFKISKKARLSALHKLVVSSSVQCYKKLRCQVNNIITNDVNVIVHAIKRLRMIGDTKIYTKFTTNPRSEKVLNIPENKLKIGGSINLHSFTYRKWYDVKDLQWSDIKDMTLKEFLIKQES